MRLYRNERVSPPQNTLNLVVVGDIMLGRGVEGHADVFKRVAPELVRADLVAGNLEGVISDQESRNVPGSARSGYALFAPPQSIALLQSAGFDLLGIANNHAGDGGDDARLGTIQRLAAAGIRPVGIDASETQAVEAHGVRLAFLAFNAVAVPGRPELMWDREGALSAVRSAASAADGVVVLMHWGSEYDQQIGLRQREAAAALAEAGADLIVGSHPHVIQGTEVIERSDGRRAFAAYSLGNFVFDQLGGIETRQGAALTASFTKDGLSEVQALAVAAGPRPSWLSEESAQPVVRRMLPKPRRWKIACSDSSCVTVALSGAAHLGHPARFDEIDLTGDGQYEKVVHHEGRVRVYDGGKLVWQSPLTWEVHDVALGDPNDDGRFELLLALRKVDEDGMVHSHPFIIGYRNGSYRQVWGGSAVADPLAEVELGDLDGDGIEEMIALDERCVSEETPEGTNACDKNVISVWRWNGWGFTQMWKSSAGNFRNLRLMADLDANLVIIVDQP
jgi:hypothetical protein